MVKEAVLNSMEDAHKRETFTSTIFILNARFPSLQYGLPLLEQWEACENYHPHVSSLLKVYQQHRESLGFPILLCEIVRRCAWSVAESSIYGDYAKDIGTYSSEEVSTTPTKCWMLHVESLRGQQHIMTTLAIIGYILTD
jgi:hypothetical protein